MEGMKGTQDNDDIGWNALNIYYSRADQRERERAESRKRIRERRKRE